jgi:integrase
VSTTSIYISPEAYKAIDGWMDFRKMAGEVITKDSWVLRTLWDVRGGTAKRPKKLSILGLKTLIQNAFWAQGLRTGLEPGKRRHEFPLHHGFRKFFKTHAAQVMKPIHVEMLMGHATGYSERSYYRPTEQDLLEDYLKAVQLLSIENQQYSASSAAAAADKIKALERKYDSHRTAERCYARYAAADEEPREIGLAYLSSEA